MTDPTFKDRAGLEAWVQSVMDNMLINFRTIDVGKMQQESDRIKRVVAAHAHLIEETPHGQ